METEREEGARPGIQPLISTARDGSSRLHNEALLKNENTKGVGSDGYEHQALFQWTWGRFPAPTW